MVWDTTRGCSFSGAHPSTLSLVSPLPSLPSLDLLDSESIRQLEVQERRSDSLDSKGGVVLGFAGVLVPLSTANLHSNVAHVGTGFAALAALLASVGFFPRNSPALNLRHLGTRT